jgi:hypothetical protein
MSPMRFHSLLARSGPNCGCWATQDRNHRTVRFPPSLPDSCLQVERGGVSETHKQRPSQGGRDRNKEISTDIHHCSPGLVVRCLIVRGMWRARMTVINKAETPPTNRCTDLSGAGPLEVVVLLVDGIVGEVHAGAVEVGGRGRLVRLGAQARQAVVEEQDPQRVARDHQHVDPQVELQAVWRGGEGRGGEARVGLD